MNDDYLKRLPPGMLAVKDESVRMDFVPALAMVLSGTVSPIFATYGVPMVINSGSETHTADGKPVKHGETSLHWSGHAVDLRSRCLALEQQRSVVDHLIAALGRHFDVVLEKDHIHIEYQPRRPLR